MNGHYVKPKGGGVMCECAGEGAGGWADGWVGVYSSARLAHQRFVLRRGDSAGSCVHRAIYSAPRAQRLK